MLRIKIDINDFIEMKESFLTEFKINNECKRESFLRSIKKTMRYIDMVVERINNARSEVYDTNELAILLGLVVNPYELFMLYLIRGTDRYLKKNNILDVSIIPDNDKLILPIEIEFVGHSRLIITDFNNNADVKLVNYLTRVKSMLYAIRNMVKK